MVSNDDDHKSSKDRVVGPLPNGQTPWLTNGDDSNHLLTGMILQVGCRVSGGWVLILSQLVWPLCQTRM